MLETRTKICFIYEYYKNCFNKQGSIILLYQDKATVKTCSYLQLVVDRL